MPLLRLYKTSSLEKRCNVYCHLLAKEYCTKSSHRRIHHVLGTLITKANYTFQKSWCKTSKKHIACDGRLAFFENYEHCIDCSSPLKKPTVKFSVQKDRPGKIEDGLLMEGYPETVNLPFKGYRGSLFALTKDNYLLRVDLENGHIMENVYMGSATVRFKKVQWNVVDESFVLCSTLYPRQPIHYLRQAGQDVTEVIQLVIMSCLPLDFICRMSITRQVFGNDTVDAAVFLNILMVMHSNNYVRMYSLERIFEKYQTHENHLYDKLDDGMTYGIYPSFVTHNIKFEERPPCLFEVRCRNRDVMLTMPPCYYVMWPFGDADGYCCYSFKTHKMVKGGRLQAEDNAFEERVSLHADDSGRIIHMKNSELRVLKLKNENCSDEPHLVEDFIIDFTGVAQQSTTPKVTLSGRVVKPRIMTDCSLITERTVLTMAYSEDQDMMVVVSIPTIEREDCHVTTVVGFYDNWNGTLLRQFTLEEAVCEAMERSIFFNLDTITHVFKTIHGKFECHVYKLQAMLNMGDEWQTKTGSQQEINGCQSWPRARRRRRR